jgi:sulfur carrier protein ThiS
MWPRWEWTSSGRERFFPIPLVNIYITYYNGRQGSYCWEDFLMEETVQLIFFGFLKEYSGVIETVQAIGPGQTSIRDILEARQIPQQIVGFTSVNDKMVSRDYLLKNGDRLKIFPVIIGG